MYDLSRTCLRCGKNGRIRIEYNVGRLEELLGSLLYLARGQHAYVLLSCSFLTGFEEWDVFITTENYKQHYLFNPNLTKRYSEDGIVLARFRKYPCNSWTSCGQNPLPCVRCSICMTIIFYFLCDIVTEGHRKL